MRKYTQEHVEEVMEFIGQKGNRIACLDENTMEKLEEMHYYNCEELQNVDIMRGERMMGAFSLGYDPYDVNTTDLSTSHFDRLNEVISDILSGSIVVADQLEERNRQEWQRQQEQLDLDLLDLPF